MKTLIVANWKMNPLSLRKAKELFNSVEEKIKPAGRRIKEPEIVICPPFIYLLNLKRQTLNIKLGAQDVFWEEKGAYTGEVSPLMLKDAGCKYVIIGHSERRRYFGETDGTVNNKIKAALRAGLNPILCVGETKEERNKNKTEKVLERQIKLALKGVSIPSLTAGQRLKLSIAYEPIWAIGSGNPCSPEEAKKISLFIRKIISNIYNIKIAEKIYILYGGSINNKNAKDYIKLGLNGLLIGGSSLKPNEFAKIVKKIS